MRNKNNNQLVPALGLIFGSAIGLLISTIFNLNNGIWIGLGAGIGLVIGSIIFGSIKKK
ncbi:MAG: hypothetical protein WDA21_03915 [Bacilli bacterium]